MKYSRTVEVRVVQIPNDTHHNPLLMEAVMSRNEQANSDRIHEPDVGHEREFTEVCLLRFWMSSLRGADRCEVEAAAQDDGLRPIAGRRCM